MKYVKGSFLGAFLGLVMAQQVFSQPQGYEIWEPDIRKFEHADSVETYAPDAVLFTGSSSIRLWSTLQEDMKPFSVIQRGYGGAKLDDFNYYARRIIYPHTFSAIVIFIANDITGNEDDKRPEEVADLFAGLLKTVREKYPDVPLCWISTTPTELRWEVWPEIKQAGELIRKYCEQDAHAYYIAAADAFLNSDGVPRADLFQPDRLHLNEKGYALWTGIIKHELEKVLCKSGTTVQNRSSTDK
ncbi:MAG: hypothetical protein JXQ80_11935 [Bacteroidales bacterium]|nr:hypothetical protein [Bacteroidales bacterium]